MLYELSWKMKESRRLQSHKMLTNVGLLYVWSSQGFCGQQNRSEDVKRRGISEESSQ